MAPESGRHGADGLLGIAVHDLVDCLVIGERVGQSTAEVGVAAGFHGGVDEHDDVVEGLGLYDVDLVGLCLQRFKVGGGELTGDLRLAGLQHLAARTGFGNLADIDILILVVVPAAAVLRIGLEHDAVPVGLGNHVGAGAAVMALVEVLNILIDHAVGHDIGRIGRRCDQVDGAGISAGDGDFILARRFHGTAVLFQNRVPDIGTALAEVHGALEGVDHLLGGQLAAVVEGHVVTELEHPDRTVFVGTPGGRQHGDDLSRFRIIVGQGLIHILQHHDAVGVFDAGIQRDIRHGVVDMIENPVVRRECAAAEASRQAEHENKDQRKGDELLHCHPSFCMLSAY